jgi:alcohol dehydrogenase (NADP+)
MPTELAAPMLCAGITTYSPLVRLGAGPGKKVGIIGLGGLGHFGILFAAALGAEVYAISHSPRKKEDALQLGARHFIDTSQKDWHKPYAFTFDFIINTADATHKFNLRDYFSTLKVMGKFHNVGMPDHPIEKLMLQDFVANCCYLGTSHLGNRSEMLSMLALASKQNIKSWVQTVDISAEGCKEVVEKVAKGEVRYRFTLVNYDKQFGKRV